MADQTLPPDLTRELATTLGGATDGLPYKPPPEDLLGYDAMADWLQEGVIEGGGLKATTAGAGLGLNVAAGIAWIADDSATFAQVAGELIRQRRTTSSTVSSGAAHASLPRLDQVIATLAGFGQPPTISVLAGTPTAGATVDNRNGASALPAGAMRIADVLVPAAFAGPFVDATHIRDRRPKARGASLSITRTANAGGTDDYTTTSTSAVLIDGTNLAPRFESSGVPIQFGLMGDFDNNQLDGWTDLYTFLDGASIGFVRGYHVSAAALEQSPGGGGLYTPAVGSHVLAPAWATKGTTTAKMYARATFQAVWFLREMLGHEAS